MNDHEIAPLLPCPFCGSQNIALAASRASDGHGSSAHVCHVMCRECGCCTKAFSGEPYAPNTECNALAFLAWNRRAVPMLAPDTQSAAAWKEGYEYGLTIGRKDPAIQEAAYTKGYKGAQAISQMLLEACRDALEMSAQLFADEVTDWRLKRVQKALREVKAAMANGIGADVGAVYAAGWYTCARWAQRGDLLHDVGSPAYERDRLQAMAKLGEVAQ